MSLKFRSLIVLSASALIAAASSSAQAEPEFGPQPPHAGGGAPHGSFGGGGGSAPAPAVRRSPPPVTAPQAYHPAPSPMSMPMPHNNPAPMPHNNPAPMPPVARNPMPMPAPMPHNNPAPMPHSYPAPMPAPHGGPMGPVGPHAGPSFPHGGPMGPVVHRAPMAPMPRPGFSPMAPGVHPIGGHARIVYGEGGVANMYHGDRMVYQQRFINGRFERAYYPVPGGAPVFRHYSEAPWGGRMLYSFQPEFRFAPGYLGWCNSSWGYGYSYQWEFIGTPWFETYHSFYRPYGYGYAEYRYTHPMYWMTDWYFSAVLGDYYAIREAELEERVEASREYELEQITKNAIAAQINAEMVAMQNGQGSDFNKYFGNPGYLYVVSQVTPTIDSNGYECTLTPGDVIRQYGTIDSDNDEASMEVVNAKRGSCSPGSVVNVSVDELVEFQNDFRGRIETGMQRMGDHFYPGYGARRF